MIERTFEQLHKDKIRMFAFAVIVAYQEQTGCNDVPLEIITRAYMLFKPHIDDTATVIEFIKVAWTINNQINNERNSPNANQSQKTIIESQSKKRWQGIKAAYLSEAPDANLDYTPSERNESGATARA